MKKLDRLFIRVDARFPDDEKYQSLPYRLRDSAYLLMEALNGWSYDKRTDGHVPMAMAETLGRKMQHSAARITALLAALSQAGFVTVSDTEVVILKYAKWQDTREEMAARSEARAEAGRRGGLASVRSKREANAKQTRKQVLKQNQAETEADSERDVLSRTSKAQSPPTPPPGDVRSKISNGPPLGPRAVELLQGFDELAGRIHSATEAIKAEEFCAELAYLTPAEMLARMSEHLAWCDEQSAHRPNSLAGFWRVLRSENDYRRDAGAAPPTPGPSFLGDLG